MIQKFRKKPVEIEAVKWDGNNVVEIQMFISNGSWHWISEKDGVTLYIATLEGKMKADIGDWIVKGVKGEFYPCKPDIFDATYEKIK
jgi:hypothetical protein